MARLNDYTAPPESIEALKRRFVRQNREIARVNSMQSLRIRSLESEVSQLLAENVSLRQQVINLTQETDRLESAKSLHTGIYAIKSQLDAKLAELSDLTSELGRLPHKSSKLDKSDPERPKAAESRPQPLDPEQLDCEDGRLPAILEDKHFPRRTLETQEIQNLAQMTSSPSQPVLEFDLSQQSAVDARSSSLSPNVHEIEPDVSFEEPGSPDPFLPPTLETRKKKKRTDQVIPDDECNNTTKQSRKSGSKRKFSPDEDGTLPDGAPEIDEFQFSRPSQSPKKHTEPLDLGRQDFSPTKTPVSIKRGLATGTTKRKVLEPKTANTNLNSPEKARASLNPDKKVSKPLGANENTVPPQKLKGKGLSQAARRPRSVIDLKEKRSQLSDQSPHPPVFSPMVQDAMNSISDEASTRTSRRRGAVVSYAEPNLRAKMRRPTTEMADAVNKNGARRSSSFQLDGLDEAGDISEGGKPGASPCPPSNEESPADLMSMSRDEDNQLSETVSRRRQSRRHSSNPKGTMPDSQNELMDGGGYPVRKRAPTKSFIQTDASYEPDDFDWKPMNNSTRRETRVAARRKSMMV